MRRASIETIERLVKDATASQAEATRLVHGSYQRVILDKQSAAI